MLDEQALQEKARRLAAGDNGEWKPSGRNDLAPVAEQVDPSLRDPKLVEKPRSVRHWFRLLSWCLIVLSIIAFLVAMWVPNMPMWAIITICAVFTVGVISLFFVGGSYKENPRLDSYGTAV
ncbi:tripartite tricarboxylate transporter TctB family protein [Bifidobacterium actinocoloniiforme]